MFAPALLILIFTKEKFKFLKNKQLWISLGIIALVLLPHLVFYTMHYGNPVTDILNHYFGISTAAATESSSRTISNIFMYVRDLPYILTGSQALSINLSSIVFYSFFIGIIIFLINLILGIDKVFQNGDSQKNLFVLCWIIIPLLVLGYITDMVEQRYVSAVMPFLFVMVAIAFSAIEKQITHWFKLGKKTTVILIFLLLIIVLIPNYTWSNQLIDNKKTSYLQVKQAGLWIKENSNPFDSVITASQPQIAYYAERATYVEGFNISEMETTISKYHPRFLILSVFEQHPQWFLNYPQEHPNLLKPVQGYFADANQQQPLLIIYEFNYTAASPEKVNSSSITSLPENITNTLNSTSQNNISEISSNFSNSS
jgi:hypothetical protein